MTNDTKLIRVLDRNIIPTSRGNCRGPVGPYKESLQRILVMISRGFHVVEVLPDKTEVALNETNYDRDNSSVNVETPAEPPKADKKAEDEKNENAQPPETNRQLSRKERKQKAREQKEAAQQAKAEEKADTKEESDAKKAEGEDKKEAAQQAKAEETAENKNENDSKKEDTTVPESAIEE